MSINNLFQSGVNLAYGGFYEPTISSSMNVAVTSPQIKYARMGNHIFCDFYCFCTPAAGSLYSFRLSLPVAKASDFGFASEMHGPGVWQNDVTPVPFIVTSAIGTKLAEISVLNTTTTAGNLSCHFVYSTD